VGAGDCGGVGEEGGVADGEAGGVEGVGLRGEDECLEGGGEGDGVGADYYVGDGGSGYGDCGGVGEEGGVADGEAGWV